MLGKKEYIGIALDNRTVDLVKASPDGKKIYLHGFSHQELVVPLDDEEEKKRKSVHAGQIHENADDIFGIDDNGQQADDVMDDLDDLDFDNLDDLDDLDDFDSIDDFDQLEEEEGVEELDLVDEADQPDSNEMLLYNYLSASGNKKNYLGLNIRSGDAIFQFGREANYAQIKKKELKEIVENKLQSVYGEIPSIDQYSYFVRPDGSLSIVSIDKEPASLRLINKVNEMYKTSSTFIRDIMPDEVALTGLYRMNYPNENQGRISCLIQFGASRCRIIFFKGHDVLQVSPVINEGTSNKGFLSTIFSKLLFQLDTGEVPGLDRIILCDNTVGTDAVEFFQKNFPDLDVEEFQLDLDLFEVDEPDLPKMREYTTAIAVAVGASGTVKDLYPELSIIPRYVHDRQKVFQLQWHGILLLIAIGLSPIVLNHFYQGYAEQIQSLEAENTQLQNMIANVNPIVQETEILELTLDAYQEQLMLFQDLSQGNIRWTVSFDEFNRAVNETGGLWITEFRQEGGGIQVQGISLAENRIPALARQFANVTLQNVTRNEVRERNIFQFSMRINNVVADEGLFTPEESRQIMEILESVN